MLYAVVFSGFWWIEEEEGVNCEEGEGKAGKRVRGQVDMSFVRGLKLFLSIEEK